MKFYELDPTRDARWTEFLARHPRASIFHCAGWLEALQLTYGYKPTVFTTSPPGSELSNALVGCEVKSSLTGTRFVSLPFSDHCEPLCESSEELRFLVGSVKAEFGARRWKYIEFRPLQWNLGTLVETNNFLPGPKYYWHLLDLQGDLSEVFGKLDKDSVQRRINHAERLGLVETSGTSEALLQEFYDLFVLTRGRHQLPPMPFAWFQNLVKAQSKALEIRVAHFEEKPVAAILTLRFRDVLYYKYGCSDARFNNLGATPWLLWQAILNAKASGAAKFDLGRTEEDNAGLLIFKNHWVFPPKQLVYWKYPQASSIDSIGNWKLKLAKRIFSHMPAGLLKLTGKLVYKHIG